MEKTNGFSLIEIIVVMGILSLLATSAFFIGLPEYNRYIISSERDLIVDELLESRARSYAIGTHFAVNIFSNGYCIQDSSNLCVVPFHDLPTNMVLTSTDLGTSTKIVIGFASSGLESVLRAEINIDQNGFIDGQ